MKSFHILFFLQLVLLSLAPRIPEDVPGYVQEACEIVSLNEVGATLRLSDNIPLEKGRSKVLGGEVFEKLGIGNVTARCYDIRHDDDGSNIVKVSYVGLEDEQRRKLRVYCRQISASRSEAS